MERYLLSGCALFSALILSSCAYHHNPLLKDDLTKETWQSQVDTTPGRWLSGTDRWFADGDVYMTQRMEREAPPSAAMSTMKIDIPNTITDLKVDGDFEVQVFGSYENNSAFIFGPNAAVREVEVRIKDNVLSLTQSKDAPPSIMNTIIRVGLQSLRKLDQKGAGRIEGRLVRSDNLTITQCGKGNVYLAGNMNLRRVLSTGLGAVTVLGVSSPDTTIDMSSSGSVNLSGNIGLRSITHHGSGEVNVIGLNSDGLDIYADGRGKIGLKGTANFKKIEVRHRVRVLAYNSSSTNIRATLTDTACIGLAGYVSDLYVDAGKSSCFWGRNLMAQDAYVRAHDNAHINAVASNKMFAVATQEASVYFYGEPRLMSQFVSGNGVVIPIFAPRPIYKDSWRPRQRAYKDDQSRVKVYKYRS